MFRNVTVTLHSRGLPVPLPEWFRTAKSYKLSRFTQIENFPPYIRCRAHDFPVLTVLEELHSISHMKPKGRPPYSAETLRYCLLLRYSSRQAYSLLLNEMALPSFSLLQKLSKGSLDALKVAKALLEDGKISRDIVLLFGEMYLQKSSQYHSGQYLRTDEAGEFYKGIVCFMIVGLCANVPTVVKAVPEITDNGDFIVCHLVDVIQNLTKIGFKVRATVCDDHSSNVNAYNQLTARYGSPDCYYIEFPSHGITLKIYLLFDSVHLVKKVRNNLFSRKKFVFPSFNFDKFWDLINMPHGWIY